MRLEVTVDYFSFSLLIGTLFAPFRQIAAGTVSGPLEVQLRAFFDRVISRLIGAAVRLIMMLIGGVVVFLQAFLGGIFVIGWALIPVLPAIGLLLSGIGWLPWQ